MSIPPDASGDILRAIARSYREELGPARAEQLVNRAMARSSARFSRSTAMRVLAPSLALAVSLLAVGWFALVDDGGPPVADSDPPAPVASSPLPSDSTDEPVFSPVVSIPTHELEEALDLIDQQKELEAAEVVVRALSTFVTPVNVENRDEVALPPSTADVETEQSSPPTYSVTGGVPPEQGTFPPEQGTFPEGDAASEPAESGTETTTGQTDPPPPVIESPPTITELGQALKVEVEELLSADPQDLAEAAEKARNAATPILEYGSEPSILLPPDQ